jgi:hypothetical protein
VTQAEAVEATRRKPAGVGARGAGRVPHIATMGVVDPFALLGVSPDASPDELAAAYRRLAKEWHPDLQATSEAAWKMVQVNRAYEAARDEIARRRAGVGAGPGSGTRPAGPPASTGARRRAPRVGAWVEPGLRRALGPELLRALHDREPVRLVVPTSTWASPQSRLAVTDRRLLWLLEDAITDRVRSLRFDAVAAIDHRLAWPRRRTATVRLRDHVGRRLVFAELTPGAAGEIAAYVRARRAA